MYNFRFVGLKLMLPCFAKVFAWYKQETDTFTDKKVISPLDGAVWIYAIVLFSISPNTAPCHVVVTRLFKK